MKLGSKIKYFLILFILSNNFSFADEKIINTPLINLKEIKPSFEEVLKGTENFEKNKIIKKKKRKLIHLSHLMPH